MKLAAWAKSQGISYVTAYRWFRGGKIPVPCYQAPGGTIIVDVEGTARAHGSASAAGSGSAALYARVSGHDQHDDLERQLARLRAYAHEHGLGVVREVKEIGSGLNGHRHKLSALLADAEVAAIVVEHRDRLMRFGADYVEAALTAAGRRLIVVETGEMKDDLVADMIDVMTSFCARLYGRRSAGRKALAGVSAMDADR
jgi:putative resolvase